MRIGLVLGGGGLTGGAYHSGVLAALADVGWDARKASILQGTSIGAITATSLAAGMPPTDMYHRHMGEPLSAEATALLSRISTRTQDSNSTITSSLRPASPELLGAMVRNPADIHPGKLAAAILPAGRMSTESIAASMDQICGGVWPSSRLRITAVRLRDGATVVFGRPGTPAPPIGAAVAASCAIPGYFAPVTINDQKYIDGGTTSVCNADAVMHDHLDVAIISAPMAIHSGPHLAADTPWRRAVRAQVDREITKLRAAGVQVFLFAPTSSDIDAMGPNPMAAGRESAVARAAFESAVARIAADSRLRQLGQS